MTTGARRIVLVAGATMALAAFASTPGGAQTTTETRISFAANSSAAGLTIAVTPPEEEEPAAGIVGASAEGEITSDGPAASGAADVLAVLGESPARVETDAPPDSSDSATGLVDPIPISEIGTIGALQGTAESASEAEDGLPSTDNDATFSGLTITLGEVPELPVLGEVGGSIQVASSESSADDAAERETRVSGSASSTGIEVSADLSISGLTAVCEGIPVEPLRDACLALAQQGEVLAVSVGPSKVECTWDGTGADCEGEAFAATIDVAGQETVPVAPGEVVTIPPDQDFFLVRVKAGSFEESTGQGRGDSASAIATGLSIELLGPDVNAPGVISVVLGQTTAGVSGRLVEQQITPRTGTELLPLFLGGSALAAAGLGLRRFLKRR